MLSNGLAEILDNPGIDLEQIISCHSRLSWHTCWNDDQVTSCQCFSKFSISCKAFHLQETYNDVKILGLSSHVRVLVEETDMIMKPFHRSIFCTESLRRIATDHDLRLCVHMTQVAGNTRSSCNIKERQVCNKRTELHQQAKRLSYSTGSSQYCYLTLWSALPRASSSRRTLRHTAMDLSPTYNMHRLLPQK